MATFGNTSTTQNDTLLLGADRAKGTYFTLTEAA
jgi:hypothetical protein